MKLKSLVLGGAAIVGLALATPAVAFTHHPSTPAERKQTDDLNAQQLAKAQEQAQAATTTTVAGGASSNMQARATTEGATNEQMASANTSAAGAAPVAAGMVALTQIANPPQTLINASVETNNGQAVGAVQKVVTGSDGKAQAVDVALLGASSKIVSIDATQLSYDQSRNVVVAQLSADQIQALPAAPQG